MWDLAEVGAVAPALSLRDDDHPHDRHRPRLLAFVKAWSMANLEREDPDLARVRAHLAELDTELVIVCDEGAWSFTRDREPQFCDRLAADATTAAAAYGVTAEAVFVIDHRGVIRFAHRPDRPLSATLTEVLDAAAEAYQWRDHHTRLERVQWTPREWMLKSLVVGCSLSLASGAVPQHTRFARGTGPVRALVSRGSITPSAETGASAPQDLAVDPARNAVSPRDEASSPLAQNAQELLPR